jgi:hypothetical protein
MNQNKCTVSDAFSGVLRTELDMLRPLANDPQRSAEDCADDARLVGLALSGGGIRSATFCLGIIQALARLRLLRAFDYLSTVSGGGYIGAWLSALIHRTRRPGQSPADALAALERDLSGEQRTWSTPGTPSADCPAEHPSVRFLRRYSNYLTPRLGVLSGDSLAAISTFLRNLLLNQVVLVAFFGALLTLPYLLLRLSRWLVDPAGLNALERPLLQTGLPLIYGLAIAPMMIAVIACGLSLVQFLEKDRFHSTRQRSVLGWIVLPSLVSAWMLALAMQAHAGAAGYTRWDWVRATTLVYLAAWAVVFWLKMKGKDIFWWFLRPLAALAEVRRNPMQKPEVLRELLAWTISLVHFFVSFFWQIPWIVLAGALGGLLFHALREGAANLPALGGFEYATAFGAPLVLLCFSAVVTLQIGLMKRLYTEFDREWWARLGGFILLALVAWCVSFAATLFAAPVVKWLAGLAVAGGLAWIAASAGGVLLGKSALTGPSGNRWLSRLAAAAPYVFILGLTIGLASLLHEVLAGPRHLCDTCESVAAATDFGAIVEASLRNLGRVSLADMAWVGGVCLAVFGLLGWRVDINLFSLNDFYGNRVVRCFLGATRLGATLPTRIRRSPHRFTGFDPEDDLPLSALGDQRPLHIVNAAMNLAGGEDLAWQTRRAAAFAFTPCHTGYEFWKSDGSCVSAYRSTRTYAANQFAYLESRLGVAVCKLLAMLRATDSRFDFLRPSGGIRLGTAVATSGAAANPNMGYHTSAALSALMSLFNVRLGRWCGNPRHPFAWTRLSPRFGGLALLQETFGKLTSRSRFLNISDGGHFENLGIYELVRRRCHVVVSVDAGCDPAYGFEDLANAIRKCWTDFGVRIEIDLANLKPRGKTRRSPSHFAVGCIHYPDAPEPGVLIYIKASLSGDEASDVKEYAGRHPHFPHESTGDQFFNENQFESYRELGRHIGLKVFAPLFPPAYGGTAKQKAAADMTPEEIRDALPGRLVEHPALQARPQSPRTP